MTKKDILEIYLTMQGDVIGFDMNFKGLSGKWVAILKRITKINNNNYNLAYAAA